MEIDSKISIIVPVFNSSKTLQKCIESLKGLDYEDYELIFVDDASDDNSADIAEGYNCCVIRLRERMGPSTARNVGARSAKGEILAFTDSDCVIPSNWLKKIVKALKDKEVVAISGGYSGSMTGDFISLFQFYDLQFRHMSVPPYPRSSTSSNFACKRNVFFEFKGFPKNTNEDMELAYFITNKYKLLWDNSIGVQHYFKDNLLYYLRQQTSWTESVFDTYFRFPSLIFIKSTYSSSSISMQLLVTAFLPVFAVAILFKPIFFISMTFVHLGILLILNAKFLKYLMKREGFLFAVKASFVIILRNMAWILGVVVSITKNTISLFARKKITNSTMYRYHK